MRGISKHLEQLTGGRMDWKDWMVLEHLAEQNLPIQQEWSTKALWTLSRARLDPYVSTLSFCTTAPASLLPKAPSLLSWYSKFPSDPRQWPFPLVFCHHRQPEEPWGHTWKKFWNHAWFNYFRASILPINKQDLGNTWVATLLPTVQPRGAGF